ncbi:MAG: T9SS type A sorting domain-containing protein [Armatimonadetes bacterium]|nr:T9SS type A sorting domain-containing protein [Armatimonadota bacterium]
MSLASRYANITARLLLLLLAEAVLPLAAVAQAPQVPDNRGRDFWFTFPPNYHNEVRYQRPANGVMSDSLYVFIATDRPTSGRITWRDSIGTVRTQRFSITSAPWLYKFSVLAYGVELAGINNNVDLVPNNQNGRIAQQYFRVEANEEVAVYAMSQTITTTDAMMALPTDVLGTRYRVMSYYSDGKYNNNVFDTLNHNTTPSQFAVTATEDNTSITIRPTVPVFGDNSRRPVSLILNRGESFLVQADISVGRLNGDLTGTLVESDKPIAVVGSHQRSTIPYEYITTLVSRDYLLEQLPPTSVWGDKYILTPFAVAGLNAPVGYDVARVLADSNGTDVYLDGTFVQRLNAGAVLDLQLNRAALLTTNRPVLVAQFKKSSQTQNDTGAAFRLGDPFMIIVPPQKQYLTSYVCSNVQIDRPPTGKVYQEQYMTIIAPTAFLGQTLLDGVPVERSRFRPVGNTCYSWGIIPVSDGVHRVECPKPVCVYLYGYGKADSYSYVAGMKFNVAPEPPIAVRGDTAFCVGGTATMRGSGGAEYQWSGGPELSCTDCPNPTAVPQTTTTYRVAITDAYGCISFDSVRVVVHPLPVAVVDTAAPICVGDSRQLHASGGTTYRWEPADGLSCTDCADPIATPTTTTTYRVEVRNAEGCSDDDSVTVQIYSLPQPTIWPDTVMCAGDSAFLGVSGGVRYRWSPAADLSCQDCPNPIARPFATTRYDVEVWNQNGCSVVRSVTVGVRQCERKAELAVGAFPAIMMCDSAEQFCRLVNTGETPVLVQSIKLVEADAGAFTLNTDRIQLPRWMAPAEEWNLPVTYHPVREGLAQGIVRAYLQGAGDSLSVAISAMGRRTTVAFKLYPDFPTTVPGDTVTFALACTAPAWQDAGVARFTAEAVLDNFGINPQPAIPGPAFPADWTLSSHVEERDGKRIVVMEGAGPTPMANGGVLATFRALVTISDSTIYTPDLTVACPERSFCVTPSWFVDPVEIELCGGTNRTIHITQTMNRIAVQGGQLHYSVAFGGECQVALYDLLGRHVETVVDGTVAEGEHTAKLPRLSSGLYLARLTINGASVTELVGVGK